MAARYIPHLYELKIFIPTMRCISVVCLAIVLLAFTIAIIQTRKHSLHSSGVGPLVFHQDVHDNVREQWRMRIQYEIDRRDAERRRA